MRNKCLAGFLLMMCLGVAKAQEVPDIPQPQTEEPQPVSIQVKRPGFWIFRQYDYKHGEKFWEAPPLRTNREILHSKLFLILNGAYVASVVTDVEYTNGKRETRASEYPVIPVIIGLDYVMDRFFTRAMSVEAPVYGIQHYVRDAVQGR